jgi:hypothetical protein
MCKLEVGVGVEGEAVPTLNDMPSSTCPYLLILPQTVPPTKRQAFKHVGLGGGGVAFSIKLSQGSLSGMGWDGMGWDGMG